MMVCTSRTRIVLPASQSGLVFLCMCLFVLFEILRPLERLLANLTVMWFQRYMNSKMASDMVSFNSNDVTGIPVTAQAQVISRLSTDMVVGKMNIE